MFQVAVIMSDQNVKDVLGHCNLCYLGSVIAVFSVFNCTSAYAYIFLLQITPKMRMTALDWITQVQVNFKVLPETQLTTVSLFDRYIQARRFTVDKV